LRYKLAACALIASKTTGRVNAIAMRDHFGLSFGTGGRVWCLVSSQSTLCRRCIGPTNQIAKACLSFCNSARTFILSNYYDLIVTVSATLSINILHSNKILLKVYPVGFGPIHSYASIARDGAAELV